MRITIPACKMNVLRSANVASLNVRLVERKLNQNPLYIVTCNGVAINMGSKRYGQRKFREYTAGYEVRTLQA
jgi:hypothetical protein